MNVSACICVLDSQGEILFTSQGWKDIFAGSSGSHISHSRISMLEPGINLCELSEIPSTDPAAWIQTGVRMILHHDKDDFSFEFSLLHGVSRGASEGASESKRVIRVEITSLGSSDRGCQVVAMDITESRRANQDGTFFARLESLTSESSLRLMRSSSAQIDENITKSLAEVSLLAGVDYSFVSKFHMNPLDEHGFSSMTHFWHPDPDRDFHQRFQKLPLSENPYREPALANQSVLLSDVGQLSDRFSSYREQCLKFGVKSVASVPIMVDGACHGYVGLVTTRKNRHWTEREIMILRVLSEIFGTAFLRQRIESSLRDREKSMLAFYRETEDPVWCYAFKAPIPIHLPKEKQLEMMIKSSHLENCNDANVRMVGKSSKEEMLQLSPDAIFGDSSDAFDEFLLNFIQDGYRSVNARTEMKLPDGSVRIWLNQAQGVIEDGKLVRVWGSSRDITENVASEENASKANLYKNSSLTQDEIQEHVELIEKTMKEERPYLDSNFNLTKFSKLVRIPDYQLSQILNVGMKTNFYDLVNRYRIERLIELWSNPARDEVSILDLAYEVGFNSKSTFNTAFKKVTGKTPSSYRAEIQLLRGVNLS